MNFLGRCPRLQNESHRWLYNRAPATEEALTLDVTEAT
jgi:hypothetical protein